MFNLVKRRDGFLHSMPGSAKPWESTGAQHGRQVLHLPGTGHKKIEGLLRGCIPLLRVCETLVSRMQTLVFASLRAPQAVMGAQCRLQRRAEQRTTLWCIK